MGFFLRVRSGRKPVTVLTCLAIALMVQASAAQAQQAAELVVHNGLIINDTGRLEADIRIKGEDRKSVV